MTAAWFACGYAVLTALLLALGFLTVMLLDGNAVDHPDREVSSWVEDHRGPTMNRLTEAVSTSGDTVPVIVLAAAIAGWLVLRRRARWALVLALGLLLELGVFLSTTYVVGRDRPPIERLDSTPSTASFPSGHVAASVVLWVGAALLVGRPLRRAAWRRTAFALGILAPAAMAVSRVYRGMHFVTDTLAGAALGIGALTVAWLSVEHGHRQR